MILLIRNVACELKFLSPPPLIYALNLKLFFLGKGDGEGGFSKCCERAIKIRKFESKIFPLVSSLLEFVKIRIPLLQMRKKKFKLYSYRRQKVFSLMTFHQFGYHKKQNRSLILMFFVRKLYLYILLLSHTHIRPISRTK